jgi:hypothetical protein
MGWIKRLSVSAKLKVHVVASGFTGATDPGDDFALLNPLTQFDQVAAVVRVSGFDSPAVIEDDHMAIAPTETGELYPADGGRVNRGPAWRAQVDTAVHAPAAKAEIRRYLEAV